MAEGLPKQKLELVASTFLFQKMDEIVLCFPAEIGMPRS